MCKIFGTKYACGHSYYCCISMCRGTITWDRVKPCHNAEDGKAACQGRAWDIIIRCEEICGVCQFKAGEAKINENLELAKAACGFEAGESAEAGFTAFQETNALRTQLPAKKTYKGLSVKHHARATELEGSKLKLEINPEDIDTVYVEVKSPIKWDFDAYAAKTEEPEEWTPATYVPRKGGAVMACEVWEWSSTIDDEDASTETAITEDTEASYDDEDEGDCDNECEEEETETVAEGLSMTDDYIAKLQATFSQGDDNEESLFDTETGSTSDWESASSGESASDEETSASEQELSPSEKLQEFRKQLKMAHPWCSNSICA